MPLYGILHEEDGAEEFDTYLKGQLLFDKEVRTSIRNIIILTHVYITLYQWCAYSYIYTIDMCVCVYMYDVRPLQKVFYGPQQTRAGLLGWYTA